MLFSGAGFKAAFSTRDRYARKSVDMPKTMAVATARAARVRRTLRASGEQRCRRAANSWVPGREAGSNASIDSSSDFRRCGTCAPLSCSTGKPI